MLQCISQEAFMVIEKMEGTPRADGNAGTESEQRAVWSPLSISDLSDDHVLSCWDGGS